MITTIVTVSVRDYSHRMNRTGVKVIIILGQMVLSLGYLIIKGRRWQRIGERLRLPSAFLTWVAVSLLLLLLVAGGVL